MIEFLFIALFQMASGDPEPDTQPVQTVTSGAGTAQAERAQRNRRRCRVETVTGSRLGARVCLSETEEEMLENEAEDLLRDSMRIWQGESSQVCDRPGCG